MNHNFSYGAFGEGGRGEDRWGSRQFQIKDMILNWNRWHNSFNGTWSSRDPIGTGGGVNLYVYLLNSAPNLTDSAGLSGGPWHPPDGVSLSCDNSDSCRSSRAKMVLLMRSIASHEGWDRNMPPPRGGGRHHIEIGYLWRAYAKCQAIAEVNCREEQKNELDSVQSSTAVTKCAVGSLAAYAAWRAARLLPSLFPPAWWTLPANLVTP
jgi:RHS repeat-associated protein